ncbi:MAG: phosphate signaling complex protein PhoU [Helicobacteraceae bacterium]|jgi:phosphate transport system protein|nr:phosphate signaling complex protein PhoU [Helicobacteraceae bacterium]
MIRSRFEEQLTELNDNLIEMGKLIENAIAKAKKALEERDAILAQEVIDGDDRIDDMEKRIESLCLKILLRQQPVARDLRAVSAALKMITDMERIADHAADIAELCEYMADKKYLKDLNRISQMAEATKKMVADSVDAFVKGDSETANSVIAYDDTVDNLYIAVKMDMIELVHKDINNGEQCFDLLQIAKYYERIGDHAVNIAEWAIFSISGKHKEAQVI